MKTVLGIISAFVLSVALVGLGGGVGMPTFAANAPAGCDKDRGTIFCQTTENVGNAPEQSNAQETTTNTTKKGSDQSSHEKTNSCEGPPGQCR